MISDPLLKSDIIVVLMGSTYDRILQAADLYYEGYANQIILVDSYVEARELAEKRDVQIYGNALISKMAAIDLGIPEKDIATLEGYARSTQDEAEIIMDYLEKNMEIKSINLVTSKYHSARARMIFEKAVRSFDRSIIEIYTTPNKYDSFDTDQWWKDRESFKKVILEYLKLINIYLREQFLL